MRAVQFCSNLGTLLLIRLIDTSSPPQVYLLGGVVTSWKMASGDEVLYVRPDAKFDGCVHGAGCFGAITDKTSHVGWWR